MKKYQNPRTEVWTFGSQDETMQGIINGTAPGDQLAPERLR